jgi:hypothetical protein
MISNIASWSPYEPMRALLTGEAIASQINTLRQAVESKDTKLIGNVSVKRL